MKVDPRVYAVSSRADGRDVGAVHAITALGRVEDRTKLKGDDAFLKGSRRCVNGGRKNVRTSEKLLLLVIVGCHDV